LGRRPSNLDHASPSKTSVYGRVAHISCSWKCGAVPRDGPSCLSMHTYEEIGGWPRVGFVPTLGSRCTARFASSSAAGSKSSRRTRLVPQSWFCCNSGVSAGSRIASSNSQAGTVRMDVVDQSFSAKIQVAYPHARSCDPKRAKSAGAKSETIGIPPLYRAKTLADRKTAPPRRPR